MTFFQIGFALLEQGRPDQAIAYYQKAVEIDPNNGAARNNLGVALERVGRPDAALVRYQKAVELDPNDALKLTNLGSTLQQQGRTDEAIPYFQRAIAANANYARAYQLLGTALREKGQIEEAIANYQKANELDPEDVWTVRALVETLQKAVERKPADAAAHFGLGTAYARLGRWKEAAAEYGKGLEQDPSDHERWCQAAAMHLGAGDVEGYRRTCRGLVQRFGTTDHTVIAERVAKACLAGPDSLSAADFDRVQKLAERAVTGTEHHRLYRHFMLAKGLAEYRAGRHAEAVQWLKRCAPNAGGDFEALALAVLAMAHHSLGAAQEAEAALAKAKAIRAKAPDPARGRPLGDWHFWVHAQVLCREAEALLKISKGRGSVGSAPDP